MAHDCPECGQACYCDQEDVWNDLASEDCEHECDEPMDDEWHDLASMDDDD